MYPFQGSWFSYILVFAGRGDWAPRKQEGIKKGRAKAVTIATEQRGGLIDGAHVWALGCSELERLNRISPKLPGPSRVPQSLPLSPMIADTTSHAAAAPLIHLSSPPSNLKFGPSPIKTINTNWYFLMLFFFWVNGHSPVNTNGLTLDPWGARVSGWLPAVASLTSYDRWKVNPNEALAAKR